MPFEVQATGNQDLAKDEYAATADQVQAAISSCARRALLGLSAADKRSLRFEIEGLKDTVGKAIDIITSQRSRLSFQEQKISKQMAAIGDGRLNFNRFHALASKAVVACDDIAAASQRADEAVSLVYSRETELAYRGRLVSILKSSLSERKKLFDAAMKTLVEMENSVF